MSFRQVVTKGPVRRAQLVAPFGVGAMVVVRDGSSLIAAGLDHWFRPPEGTPENMVDVDEFKIEEWRLQKELNVSHFRLPPDYRERRGYSTPVPNAKLTMPYLRFPTWHYCTSCQRMYQLKLTTQALTYCPHCLENKVRRRLVQVPVVALCEHGHMQDFPWREWVHSTPAPSCLGTLKLRSTGGATLSATRVECTACGESRSLGQVMGEELILSPKVSTEPLECTGIRPWLGETTGMGCGAYLRGSLRTASNVYFAQVRSAIYLPRTTAQVSQELLDLLTGPKVSALFTLLGDKITADFLRTQLKVELMPHDDKTVTQAVKIILGGQKPLGGEPTEVEDCGETAFRRAEFDVLITERDESVLKIRPQQRTLYKGLAAEYFARIQLVDKLLETRALAGFSRINTETRQPEHLKKLLRRHPLPADKDWLPAYQVFGEGIFLQVDEDRLCLWEERPDVKARVQRLQNRYDALPRRERVISPRFVMLHTLAHLLMNRLTFECGYSSASLRERLYVALDPETPAKSMAGIMIYTAAGDSEGTMGGLVRMGKPGLFEDVLLRALQGARWCSADPVCIEMGGSSGQGPNSLNLAACHSCGLVPETACEEFNMFLDRALLVGDLGNPNLGFFAFD